MLDRMLRQDQVDQNYESFKRLMPELLRDHAGKYAVIREGIVIKFFDTNADDHLVAANVVIEYPARKTNR